jgi:hypothetical protein
MNLLLRAHIKTVDQFNGRVRDFVAHFHPAHMEKTTHQSVPNLVRVAAHLCGNLIGRTTLERLEDFPGHKRERVRRHSNGSDRSQLVNFCLELPRRLISREFPATPEAGYEPER